MKAALATVLIATVARAAPPVQAPPPEPEPPETPRALGVTATATSTAKKRDPAAVLGSDPTKLWCEGNADEGLGETLVLKLAAPTKVDSLTIRAGMWQSPELFHSANRITELRITTDDGFDKTVTFREERENVDVKIDHKVGELRLQIATVAKGKVNDTCISAVDIHTDPESQVIVGLEADAAAAIDPAFVKSWKALDHCDDVALKDLLRFPFGGYGDAKAVKKACKAGAFKAFVAPDLALRLKSPAHDQMNLVTNTLEWQFVRAGKTWKLAHLVDHSR
jgi:hypothetical protein